jgi:hypothetical protein
MRDKFFRQVATLARKALTVLARFFRDRPTYPHSRDAVMHLCPSFMVKENEIDAGSPTGSGR